MGAISFTPKQREVIEARNSTVLVSAAAGSGKTAVLVQRVIEKLLDEKKPQDINRLLVVTFTNAAAAQMKERIGKRLSEVLSEKEHENNVHLQKQALLLRNAPITTLHGFCLSLLREFFYELDLDPSFRIAEEGELTLLRADVMEELLEEYYSGEKEEEQELFLRLTECLGTGKNDDALVDTIEKIDRFAQSAPFPESFYKEAVERMQYFSEHREIPDEDPCLKSMTAQMLRLFAECRSLSEHALALCVAPGGPVSYREAVEDDVAFFTELTKAKSYEDIRAMLSMHPKFAKLSTKKCDTTEEQKEKVKQLRTEYKKEIDRVWKDFFFATREQMAQDMADMAPLAILLLSLCRQYRSRFAKAKAERAILDFSDLEHYAVRLLVSETPDGFVTTETAKQIRERFDEIMVDECQDSNRIQDLLTWSISGEEEGRPNRFMVGDVKQSIYKFRMAMPELFMKKYEEYGEEGPFRKIVLGRNFRSRASVVDYVNAVFSLIMRKDFGGIEYDDEAKLYCYAAYPSDTEENKTELILTELTTEEDTEESPEKVAREAYTVGGRIKELLTTQFPVTDGEETLPSGETVKKTRPIRYGDITILFRSMSGCAEQFLEVFSELSIPAVAETRTGYFQAQEVCVALNALRILDNPRQDIPLVSVLHSEMVGMTEEELAAVRVITKREKGEPQICFYEAVKEFLFVTGDAEQKEEPVVLVLETARKKLLRFFSWYQELYEKKAYVGVPELLAELFSKTAYPDFVRVKAGGERRAENLYMLIEKAKSFEETSYSGIFDFIRYVERLVRYEIDSGEAQTASGADAVRLMSIHKSKGLEAPVVFVCGLSGQFNFRDVYAEVVLHTEIGIGMKYRDEKLRVEAPTLYKKGISDCLKKDMLSEELRVLYVALTRAQEKLILSATVKTREDFEEKVGKTDTNGEVVRLTQLASARSYLDFLLPTIGSCCRQGCLEVKAGECTEQSTEAAVLAQEAKRIERLKRLEEIRQRPVDCTEDEELFLELGLRKSFRYPYPHYSGKRKLSVSELKKAAYEEEVQEELFPEKQEACIPKFAKTREEELHGLSGSERGTLYHRIMECMDFQKEYRSQEQIEAELERLVMLGRLRSDVKKLISIKKLQQFFASGLAERMQAAARKGLLRKEQPFVIGIPYEELYGAEGNDKNHAKAAETVAGLEKSDVKIAGAVEDLQETATEYIMVQGIIDACFEENDELVLVDYKTDSVSTGVREELTKRYRTQLQLYARALTQMTGKKVHEKLIYAFSNGEAFAVADDA